MYMKSTNTSGNSAKYQELQALISFIAHKSNGI